MIHLSPELLAYGIGPIANGTELDGLEAFANGATALVTCLVLLMVTGVLRLVLGAHRPTHPASATSRP